MPLFVKIIHLIYAIFGDGRKQKTGSLLSYAIEHTTHNTQHTTHKAITDCLYQILFRTILLRT